MEFILLCRCDISNVPSLDYYRKTGKNEDKNRMNAKHCTFNPSSQVERIFQVVFM